MLPYYYHIGRRIGTEEFPLPSKYPTIPQVIAEVCEVFQDYGRSCSVYPRESLKGLPRITPTMLGMKFGLSIVSDARTMVYYLVHEHSRWIRTIDEEPKCYRIEYIGRVLSGAKRTWAFQSYRRARGLIGTDECFTHLYFLILQRLADRYSVHFEGHYATPRRGDAA